jgi:initiation factor 1A
MVKNQTGGNKSKKMGRKFVSDTASSENKKVRLATEEGELYAVVTKILGNGMFYANDVEGKERLCIMRNKFRGRGKHDNTVSLGTWVLIGEREFESSAKPKCDLLEVYTDIEKQKLKKSGNPIFLKLKSEFDNTHETDGGGDEVTFDNGDVTDTYSELLKSVNAQTTDSNNNSKNKQTTTQTVIMDGDDEVDIDDI